MSEDVELGFDPARGSDTTVVIAVDPQTGVLTPIAHVRDLKITLALNTKAFGVAMDRLVFATREATFQFTTLGAALRLFSRRHRTGHRHHGMRDWGLRYAPARKDLPLGQRTLAKARAR